MQSRQQRRRRRRRILRRTLLALFLLFGAAGSFALAWLLVSDQVSEELLCRIDAELFPVVTCTDAFSHRADFRKVRNFPLEKYPDHAAAADALVEELKSQLAKR